MDKKSPKDVSSKLTDAFGSKGVVERVVPDDELPTDAEGNRADILTLGNSQLSPFTHGGGARGMMFGQRMGQSDSNPLGISSVDEIGAQRDIDFINSILTDEQKAVIGELGLITAGKFGSNKPEVVYVTISVPVDAGKTSRVQALRKLLDETPNHGQE